MSEALGKPKPNSRKEMASRIEAFDTFWEAPEDIEKGYQSFLKFYRRNYLRHLPAQRGARILVISCGAGYFLNLLKQEGYNNVVGIDSDPKKIAWVQKHGLAGEVAQAFPFLEQQSQPFDLIFAEQEINHLTKRELEEFLQLSSRKLAEGGTLIVHSINGANPITGSEAFAQNFDHHFTMTEYSLRQVLEYAGYSHVKVFPLNLYVFYGNPLNYLAMAVHSLNTLFFRLCFRLYGKSNRIFTKKIGAVCRTPGKAPSFREE